MEIVKVFLKVPPHPYKKRASLYVWTVTIHIICDRHAEAGVGSRVEVG